MEVQNGSKEEADDDMSGGDLGYGLGRKPGGIYEKVTKTPILPLSPSDKFDVSSPEILHSAKENGNISFEWTSYSTLYSMFRKKLSLDKNPGHWRLNSTDAIFELSNEELKQRLQEVAEVILKFNLEINILPVKYLNQQRLELLAMLNVREQKIFQGTLPPNSNDIHDGSALELAIVGACRCNPSGADPCPCSRTAAASRKQVLQLKQEIEREKKMKDEAYVMADAFRIAFEQQLKRRTDQTLRLTEKETFLRKESLKVKKLKEEGFGLIKGHNKTMGQLLSMTLLSTTDCRKLEALEDPLEILRILVDMLNDKEEALAHQRKVSYMLARNAQELEKDITQLRSVHLPGGCGSLLHIPILQQKQESPSKEANAQYFPYLSSDCIKCDPSSNSEETDIAVPEKEKTDIISTTSSIANTDSSLQTLIKEAINTEPEELLRSNSS
ncbi:CC125 protein, partial [Polypterus senegalus]